MGQSFLVCLFVMLTSPGSTHVLADPTAFEEPLLETTLSVIVDAQGSLLASSQLGDPLMDSGEVVAKCIQAAQARALELSGEIYAS
jgi:exosome complex component RRP43